MVSKNDIQAYHYKVITDQGVEDWMRVGFKEETIIFMPKVEFDQCTHITFECSMQTYYEVKEEILEDALVDDSTDICVIDLRE